MYSKMTEFREQGCSDMIEAVLNRRTYYPSSDFKASATELACLFDDNLLVHKHPSLASDIARPVHVFVTCHDARLASLVFRALALSAIAHPLQAHNPSHRTYSILCAQIDQSCTNHVP